MKRQLSRPVVGVMGSGAAADVERADALGRLIARRGWHLLTGGGAGQMEAVARAFVAVAPRAGLSIGVIPSDEAAPDDRGRCIQAKPGYPNDFIELPVYTHLPLSGSRGTDPMSRNHINVLSSDAIVALAGGEGTASEVRLALEYRKPIVAFVADPDDIPGRPFGDRWTSDLDRVEAFLDEALARKAG